MKKKYEIDGLSKAIWTILFFRNKTSTSTLNFLKIELEGQRQKNINFNLKSQCGDL